MTFLCFIHPIFTVVVSRLIIQNLNKASIYYVCMHGTTVGFGEEIPVFSAWEITKKMKRTPFSISL